MGVINVLTYNVCFGCMLGSGQDRSARPLALRCAKSNGPQQANRCLQQVARNIDLAGDCCGGLDLVGLQEASAWELLQVESRELFVKKPVVTKVGPEEIVLFLGGRFDTKWLGEGQVSGRPLQLLLLRDNVDDTAVIVVHLHNHHKDKGTTELLLKSIAAVRGVEEALSSTNAANGLTVVCMGDWNDGLTDRRGLKPFALCACPALRDLTVSAVSTLPKSCCSTSTHDKHMPFAGDYVMSNMQCWNGIPEQLLEAMRRNDASDHYAVLAQVGGVAVHPLVRVLCGSRDCDASLRLYK